MIQMSGFIRLHDQTVLDLRCLLFRNELNLNFLKGLICETVCSY